MIKRILVGLAGTTYTPVAIQRAVTLAQAHDAEVTGVTVLDRGRVRCEGIGLVKTLNREEQKKIARSHIEQSVHDLEAACQSASIKHRVVKESGDPFTAMIDLARYHDLMVFGLRSVLEYDFLTGDSESLLIRLVSAGVRPLIAVSENYRSISRVLIAYSGSMDSAKAMKRFVQMRLWPDAELRLFAFHPSNDKAHELLVAAEEYCRAHGYRVTHDYNPGDPKVLLLAAANLWQADMIVMGDSARSVLVRQTLGDTLFETLRISTLPMFLA